MTRVVRCRTIWELSARVNKSPSEARRIVTFAIIGLINTCVDVGIYALLTLAGIGIFVANLISTTAGLGVSFFLNGRYTFGDIPGSVVRRVVLFVAGNVVGLWLLQPGAIWVGSFLLDNIGDAGSTLYILLPKLFGVGVALAWNYLWYRYVVFVPARRLK